MRRDPPHTHAHATTATATLRLTHINVRAHTHLANPDLWTPQSLPFVIALPSHTCHQNHRCSLVSEKNFCRPKNAALVCISSETENDEVMELAGDDDVWIGFNDGQDDGASRW